jgi:hypothetical protein
MQVVELKWHPKQRVYSGHAESTRGRRYFFGANSRGKLMWADRYEPHPYDGFRRCLRYGPPALGSAMRVAIRQERGK